ncbi:MAG: TonB-dependent receptor [Bacteroidales bacterium]|nr:TonB-dependent receptor [Bacteroidales bacterium]
MRAKVYALALCICTSIAANAQDVEHDAITIQDNATKKQLLTPKAVESVDNAFIRGNMGGSLSESLAAIPGMSQISIGSSQGKPIIRGMGFQRIAVIEDNIRHEAQQWGSDHGLEVDQYAVLEAEVIKGPSSLEYGSDAVGGVLKLNTFKVPSRNTVSGSVNFTAKSSNRHFGGSANVAARKDKFFITARATAQDYADYKVPTDHVNVYSYKVYLHDHKLRNTAGREYDFGISTGIIGSSYKLRLSVSDVNSRGGFFANAHGLEPRRIDEEAYDSSSRDIQTPSYSVGHLKAALQLDKWTSAMSLTVNAAYQHNVREEQSAYVSHGFMPTHSPESLTNPDIEYLYDKHVFSGNVTVSFPFKGFDIKTGVSAEYQDNDIGGRCFIIPAFRSATAGAFASAEYRIATSTILQAGIRYDIGNITTDKYQDWFTSEGEYATRAEAIDRNFGDMTFGCGVTSRHGKFNYKLNIAKGFRMPTAKELAANGVNYHKFSYERGDSHLNSETSYQADLQIDYLSRLFTVSVSPFVGYFTNYIFLNPTPYFDRLYGNGNQIYNYQQCKVLRYGGEAQAKLVIDNRMSLMSHSKIEVAVNGEIVKAKQLSGDKKGYSLPFAPPASIGMEATYTYRLKNNGEKPHKIRIKEFFVGANAKKRSKVTNIVPPEDPTDGYFLMDASAGCTAVAFGKEISLTTKVKNLWDTVYFDHTSFYRLINVPGQGRDFTININIKF